MPSGRSPPARSPTPTTMMGSSDRMDSKTALIVIDMLNPYDHEDADVLAENVEPILQPMAELVAQAKDGDVDLVYVNDNYGDFTATRHDVIRRALDGRRPDLIEPIVPPPDTDFLVKVRHSAFYST